MRKCDKSVFGAWWSGSGTGVEKRGQVLTVNYLEQ